MGILAMEIGQSPTTFDLNDQADDWTYRLVTDSWAPAPVRRSSAILNDLPYDDAIETFALNIGGSTIPIVQERHHALVKLFDDARVFARDGGQDGAVPPILWKVVVDDDDNLDVSMIIPEPDDPDCVVAASSYVTDLNGYVMRAAQVTFRRKPLLIEEITAGSTASAAAAIGTIQTTTFTQALDIPAPTDIEIGRGTLTAAVSVTSGVVLVSEDGGISNVEAQNAGAAGAYSTPLDAANFPTAARVLRYTPTLTTRVASGQIAITLPLSFLTFVELRKNTTAPEYVVDIEVLVGGQWIRSRPVTVSGTSVGARSVALGLITTRAAATAVRIGLQASATGGTLDIDRLLFVRMNGVNSYVIEHGAATLFANAQYFKAEHRYLTDLHPLAYIKNGIAAGGNSFASVPANPLIRTADTDITACWLAYDGTAAWGLNNGAARYTVDLQASREVASLTPR